MLIMLNRQNLFKKAHGRHPFSCCSLYSVLFFSHFQPLYSIFHIHSLLFLVLKFVELHRTSLTKLALRLYRLFYQLQLLSSFCQVFFTKIFFIFEVRYGVPYHPIYPISQKSQIYFVYCLYVKFTNMSNYLPQFTKPEYLCGKIS